jgi:glycine hydroxymethyltransferase
LHFMEQHNVLHGPQAGRSTTAAIAKFAIGADHGGFELKEALKAHLQQRGCPFRDFGTQSKESSIDHERKRQQENIELIASENFTSRAVMEAQGSCLTNKYAEGYPKKRWYGGCENVDVVEQLAIDRAKQLFGAEHANVQPHSGSRREHGRLFLRAPARRQNPDHGSLPTAAISPTATRRISPAASLSRPLRRAPDDERIDYDALANGARAQAAHDHRRRRAPTRASLISSACARSPTRGRVSLRGHGAHRGPRRRRPPSQPDAHADFVTTTTHKSLRGPRGGIILQGKIREGNRFAGVPRHPGRPAEHVIAGKAVCFHEALQPSFKAYQRRSSATPRPSPRHEAQRLPARQRRHGQSSHARGCRRQGRHGQGLPDRPRRRRASP